MSCRHPLLSFAAAGVDKLRILVDSDHRERLEAEEAKCTMLDSEEQAWHVDTASVPRGGRWRKGQGSNADNLSGRLFDIFLLNERRKKCRYSCSHRSVLKRSVVAQEGFAVCNTQVFIISAFPPPCNNHFINIKKNIFLFPAK